MNQNKKNNLPKKPLVKNKGIDLDDFLSEEIAVLDNFHLTKPKKQQPLLLENKRAKKVSQPVLVKPGEKKAKAKKAKVVITDPRILKKRSRLLTIGVSLIGFGIIGPLLSFAILNQIDKQTDQSAPITRPIDSPNDTLQSSSPQFTHDNSLPAFYNSYQLNKQSEINGIDLSNQRTLHDLPIASFMIHNKLVRLLNQQLHFNYSWLYSDIAYLIRKTYDENKQAFIPLKTTDLQITKSSDNNPLHVYLTANFEFRNQTDSPQTFVFRYFNQRYEKQIQPKGILNLKLSSLSASNDIDPLKDPDYIGSIDPVDLAPGYGYINAVVTKDLYHNYYLNWNLSNLELSMNDSNYRFSNFIFNNNVPSMNILLKKTIPGKDPYQAASDLVGENKLLNRDLTPEQISRNLKYYFSNEFHWQIEWFNLIRDVFKWLIVNNNTNKKLYQVLSDNAAVFAKLFSYNFIKLNINYADRKNAILKLITDALSSNPTIVNAKNVYEVLYDNFDAFKLILNTYFFDVSAHSNLIYLLTKDVNSAFDFYQRLYELMPFLRQLISNFPTKIKYFEIIERILGYRDDAGNLIPIPRFNTYLINTIFESKRLLNDIYDQLLNISNVDFDMATANTNNGSESWSRFTPLFNFLFIQNRSTLVNLFTQSTNYFDDLIKLFISNNFNFLFQLLKLFGINVNTLDPFFKTALDLIFLKNPEILSRDNLKAKIINLFNWIIKSLDQTNINKIKFGLYKPENFDNLVLTQSPTTLKVKKLDLGFKFDINGLQIPYGVLSALFEFLPNIKIVDFIKYIVDDKRYEELKEKGYQQAINEGYSSLLNASGIFSFKWAGDPAKNFFSSVFDDIWKNRILKGISDNNRTIKDLANEIFSGTNNNDPNRAFATINGTGYFKWSGENVDILPFFEILPSNINQAQIVYQLYNVDQEKDFSQIYQNLKLHFPRYSYRQPGIPFSDLSKKIYQSISWVVDQTLNYSLNRKYLTKTRIILPGENGKKTHLILQENNPYENVALFTYNANQSLINQYDRMNEQDKRKLREQILMITDRRARVKGIDRDPKTRETSLLPQSLRMLDSLIQIKGVDPSLVIHTNWSFSTISERIPLNLKTGVKLGLISKQVSINLAYETFLSAFSYQVLLPYPILDLSNPNNPVFKLKEEISHLVFSLELFGAGE
ncbi:hypothetical protein RUS47_01200 [Mycoplasmoides gallisepticum]|uniref:P116 family lipid acquisition surface protein n=1 Tax=Mycoplasmoides gallisepticum TaxID=2096 RepID=UPI00124757CA|nr:hypothetical protein [Mycoplasmoides gallisepticum]QEX47161.1 hypothetical protein F6J63_01200 [Mycoplasmoides gallisepticum]ULH62478.1 hypothetical protein MHC98_01230 [Mycoplasmoides gallisepticum]ULH67813.1 hypothetical protein MHC97_01215 [Mycoplasmoides gallisepticum]ULH68543.1 hypothetical protein MHC99_01220 [Mycoplasmoides gallisepticum]WGG24190.1 hypothetical protein P0D30_01245 [Mycoplasmoides gallisepticum]